MKRKLGFLLTSIFLISLGVVVVIVSNTRADQNILARFAFFVFLGVAIASLFVLAPIAFHSIKHVQIKKHELKKLFRRAILVSAAIVGLVVFSALHVLNFLSGLTFALSLLLVEFFFMARKVEKNNEV